ncbi:MAG: hypothetical protein PHU68_01215 [Paludibacter sp.]|nr:hypothetical protein [Paludibacter sp.]
MKTKTTQFGSTPERIEKTKELDTKQALELLKYLYLQVRKELKTTPSTSVHAIRNVDTTALNFKSNGFELHIIAMEGGEL